MRESELRLGDKEGWNDFFCVLNEAVRKDDKSVTVRKML